MRRPADLAAVRLVANHPERDCGERNLTGVDGLGVDWVPNPMTRVAVIGWGSAVTVRATVRAAVG